MTKKTTYWMTDGYGGKALVEGAEERDRWAPLGWAEADEPAAGERVWLRHEGHGGRAQFPTEAVALWQQKGWQPSDPPAPVSPFNAPEPADVAGSAAPVTDATPKTSATPATKTSSQSEKR